MTPIHDDQAKTLVAGWFSFEYGHATAGDLLARDLACEWLARAGHSYDIAVAPPFRGGVDWRLVNPQDYSHVLFVCGPFTKGELETKFLEHFANCRLIGLDLSMLVPLDVWNPFDLLLERDSSIKARPDVTFLSRQALVPVVGVCLVELYEGAMVEVANAAIRRLLASREMSVVEIDTRLDTNSTGLRTPSEVESLIARMDMVVTTRLHGTVLALKNGVPAIAIDPEVGGAKIQRQAETMGWPVVFTVDALTDAALQQAFDYCLTEDARTKVRECCGRATKMIQEVRDEFITALALPSVAETNQPPVFESGPKLTASCFGWPRQVTPVSRCWGYDRGLPIDRYYIENFLSHYAADVQGRVLEVGDNSYTRRFGGDQVAVCDVLHVAEGNPSATIVADLTRADHIPSNTFDCVILTQTLHLIYDVRAAINTLHRVLKPGGVLLATFPGITAISHREWVGSWFWGFTSFSARRLFEEVFPAASVQVESHGNVLAASAFLYGLAVEDLRQEELDQRDPDYEVSITVRAVKSGGLS